VLGFPLATKVQMMVQSCACTFSAVDGPYLTSQNLDDRDLRGFRPRLSIDSRQRARFGSYVSEEPNVTILSTFQLGKVLLGEPLLTIRPRREYSWHWCAKRDRRGSTSSSHFPSSTGMAHHKVSVVRVSRGFRSPIWRANVHIVPSRLTGVTAKAKNLCKLPVMLTMGQVKRTSSDADSVPCYRVAWSRCGRCWPGECGFDVE